MDKKTLGPPQCGKILSLFCRIWLRLAGWKLERGVPNPPKMVLIFAHHTSSWDFFYILPTIFGFGLKPYFLGKKELFEGPLGFLTRWVGGIPVDRFSKTNTVDQIVNVINEKEQIIIGVAPEGTRNHATHWKTGFYHMALKAKVPIVYTYLDYGKKTCGIVEGFIPSGDMEADFNLIRNFFSKVTGKNPENMGEIAIKQKVEA